MIAIGALLYAIGWLIERGIRASVTEQQMTHVRLGLKPEIYPAQLVAAFLYWSFRAAGIGLIGIGLFVWLWGNAP